MRGLALILLLLVSSGVFAHKPSDSYLYLDHGASEDGATLSGQWDIALKDIDYVIGLDSNQDGKITWGELKAQREALTAWAFSRLTLQEGEQTCGLKVNDLLVSEHSDGRYAALMFSTDCDANAASWKLNYQLLFDVDPTHRAVVVMRQGEQSQVKIVSPEQPTLELNAAEQSLTALFVEFVRQGVWHIWIGLDHILFLLALMLPMVWRRENGQWQPQQSFRGTAKSVFAVVTVFTMAHSITLWLAVMEYVVLPAKWVEVVIAGSIIATVLNNLVPFLAIRAWVLAFVFGLMHGFGFANVLLDIGLGKLHTGISLLGFNIGVELGQLVIVLLWIPLAWKLRATNFYRWGIFGVGSAAVLLLSIIWIIERAFEISLLS